MRLALAAFLATLAWQGSPSKVTASNFRLLRFEQQGGIAALHSVLRVEAGGLAEYRLEIGDNSRSETKELGPSAMQELFAVLNRNDFLSLRGSYSERGADLIAETIYLATDTARTEVRNEGEAAPSGYVDVRNHLVALVAREFQ